MIEVIEYADIRTYTTFKVGGQFRYLLMIRSVDDLVEAFRFANEKKLPIVILGGGSNVIFPDGLIDKVILVIDMKGFEVVADDHDSSTLTIGAGEIWDEVVAKSVQMNLSGIEAMSAIPGKTGATLVQNVGAYGQEIKDTLVTTDVYDRQTGEIKRLSNIECEFSYRDSIFKHSAREKYIILSITVRLSKKAPHMPKYPGVEKYFTERGVLQPTLSEIREAIIHIRKTKLPDPKDIPSAGSFFKNPIVSKEQACMLKARYPDIILFHLDDENVKIPAGWLIEQAGFKGQNIGPILVYPHNALVLVNKGSATSKDVITAKDVIIQGVEEKFSIRLEQEPEML